MELTEFQQKINQVVRSLENQMQEHVGFKICKIVVVLNTDDVYAQGAVKFLDGRNISIKPSNDIVESIKNLRNEMKVVDDKYNFWKLVIIYNHDKRFRTDFSYLPIPQDLFNSSGIFDPNEALRRN